jgi:hypothetical protein
MKLLNNSRLKKSGFNINIGISGVGVFFSRQDDRPCAANGQRAIAA